MAVSLRRDSGFHMSGFNNGRMAGQNTENLPMRLRCVKKPIPKRNSLSFSLVKYLVLGMFWQLDCQAASMNFVLVRAGPPNPARNFHDRNLPLLLVVGVTGKPFDMAVLLSSKWVIHTIFLTIKSDVANLPTFHLDSTSFLSSHWMPKTLLIPDLTPTRGRHFPRCP